MSLHPDIQVHSVNKICINGINYNTGIITRMHSLVSFLGIVNIEDREDIPDDLFLQILEAKSILRELGEINK